MWYNIVKKIVNFDFIMITHKIRGSVKIRRGSSPGASTWSRRRCIAFAQLSWGAKNHCQPEQRVVVEAVVQLKSWRARGLVTVRSLNSPPSSGRQGLIRISSYIGRSIQNEVNLSICAYNCKSLSTEEFFDHLLQEVWRPSCDILGVCGKCHRVELNITWIMETRFSRAQVRNNEISAESILALAGSSLRELFRVSFTHRELLCFSFLQYPNKTPKVVQVYVPITASDDSKVEEFYGEFETTHRQIHLYGRRGRLQCQAWTWRECRGEVH